MASKNDEVTTFSVDVPVKKESLQLEKSKQITFCWDNLTVTAKGTDARKGLCGTKIGRRDFVPDKNILQNVSGYCKPGEVLAIMGASGAGKSTLLNALTFRNLSGLTVKSGARCANGVTVTPNSLTSVSAYVQQDDLFIGTLTVREHLNFQAAVRMDRHVPHEERMQRVEEVMRELGLKKCEKTLIGVQGRIKGISGGEAKRLAVASEVITNPPLLFCDEPTSGLDSYMAQNVVEVLKNLSDQGKTIVCTIHQPSSQVFAMFDRILLMAEGRVAFLGNTNDAVDFFQNINRPCPYNFNPADHYIHVLAVRPGTEAQCREEINSICDSFTVTEAGRMVEQEVQFQIQHALQTSSDDLKKSVNRSPYKASWIEQFRATMWRSFLSVIKEPMLMHVRVISTVVMAFILGILYLGQEENQVGIQNINGALFLMLTNMTFSNMFSVVNVFCAELPIFLREHFNGMYRTDVYFLSKQLVEFPIFLVTPILFCAIFYFMVGMNEEFARFCIACLVLIAVTQVVVGFGYMVSCIAPDVQVALALAPAFIIPVMIFGGFFLNGGSLPVWLSWLQYISWFKYSNEILVVNQWRNVTFTDCDHTITPNCVASGEEIFAQLNFEEGKIPFNFGMLVVLAVGFRIVGYFALLAKTFRKSS